MGDQHLHEISPFALCEKKALDDAAFAQEDRLDWR